MNLKLPPSSSHSRSEPYQTAAIVANGVIANYSLIASLIRSYEYCIAVDGGLLHCRAMNIIPNLIIGDFDSLDKKVLLQYEGIPIETFREDKDDTDVDLALKVVFNGGAEKIGLFGVTEGRMDHALYNLHLLQRFPGKLFIESDYETIFDITGEREIACEPGQTISLIPLGLPAKGVTTQGLKWELKNAVLNQDYISLSNICIGKSFKIKIAEGNVLCCMFRMKS